MSRLSHISLQRDRRQNRVRSHIQGTSSRPRLSIFISNRHVTAQIIDDEKKTTLAYATTVGQKANKASRQEIAQSIGKEIANKAKEAKIKRVVLDRGSKLYHGRVKALADAARSEGLEF